MKITNLFPDKPAWLTAKHYFQDNGSESPANRLPSPDKITTPPRGSFVFAKKSE